MKTTSVLLVTGLIGLLTSAVGLRADMLPSWAAKNTAGAEVQVAVSAPVEPRYAHLSWNKAVRTAKGTVVLAYIAGTFHGSHGGGCPAVSRSTDAGRSFSAPKVLREFGPGLDYTQSGNIALGLTPDGALVFLAMAYDNDSGNHIFGWRSVDDGVTWTPVDTSALGPNKTGSVFGSIQTVKGQGLMVLGHYRQPSKPYSSGIWKSISRDDGRTWGEAQRISDAKAVEPVLVQSRGRLLAFLRGDKSLNGRQFVAVSDDQGGTWKTEFSSLDAADPKTARLAAPCAVENPNKPGEILVLTTERAMPGNTPGRIWLWRGDAKKLQWKRERVLLEFPKIEGDRNTDFGYPWLLHVAGNRWMMFYYHGQGKSHCPLWVTEVKL